MSSRWIAAAGLALLLIVGLATILRGRAALSKRHDFALEFADRLRQYVESEGRDSASYGWLVHRSNRIQTEMGTVGVYGAYRPPFANFQYRDYPIVLNMLPDLRNAYGDPILSRSQAGQYANALIDSVVRYLGVIEDRDTRLLDSLRNPFAWLREGARLFVKPPVTVLAELGLVSAATADRWRNGGAVRVLAGIVSLVSLASGVIGIAVGWEPFVAWMRLHGWL
jgi:hypothetical protein